jgi:ribosome-associated protein
MGSGPFGASIIDAKTLAATIARLCQDKKAENIQVVSVQERLGLADYFVLVTGLNRTHVRALQNELHVKLKALGERHLPIEGAELSWWVVMDFGDVVVHLLQPEARAYYELERLYAGCPLLDWESVEPAAFTGAQAAEA